MKDLFSIFLSLSTVEYLTILCVANIIMYFISMAITYILRSYFIKYDLNHSQHKLQKRDYNLSIQVLIINVVVGVIGWTLFKNGKIQLMEKSAYMFYFDTLLIFCLIDIGMYFSHLITHKTFLYSLTHKVHHEHESMTLISLYVMHPLEALGFGMILISILIFYPIDIYALLIFLFLKWILGVFAHSGIEPSKGRLANYICMTRFHQIHHENPSKNFGFYTPFLDMIFRTRAYKLKKET